MAVKHKRVIRAFGAVLRELRTAKGFTQEQLSEKSDYAPHYISVLENGHFQPSLSAIVAFEEALGLEGGELVRRTRVLVGGKARRQ